MTITKQMIDDLFKVITDSLNVVAKVDPNATTLTPTELAVDVLAATFASLQSDIEQYFLQPGAEVAAVSRQTNDALMMRAQAIANTPTNPKASVFENIWAIAQPILNLVVDTVKVNLPKGSTACNAILTTIDALLALGGKLANDLPKLKQS